MELKHIDKEAKILLTGATGFLGSYILRYLVNFGFSNIFVIKRKNAKLSLVGPIVNEVNWIILDLSKELLPKRVTIDLEYVIHAAAQVSFFAKGNIVSKNTMMTSHLLESISSDLKKIIYISSVAALGKTRNGDFIDNNYSWTPSKFNSLYAISKRQSELIVLKHRAEGKNVDIVRPSFILGAGFWKSGSVKIFDSMRKGKIMYPIGSNGFVDVRDVARFAIWALFSEKKNQDWIVNTQNCSYKNVMDLIAGNLGIAKSKFPLDGILYKLVKWVSPLIAFIMGKHTIFNKTILINTYTSWKYPLLDDAPFEPIPIDQTIVEVCQEMLKKENKLFGLLSLTFDKNQKENSFRK